jgi:hypothetical protein
MTEMPVVEDDFEERKNTGRCVVAIPTATEPIHHIGDPSEPKHTTVLWLGTPEENPELDMDAVQEAVRAKAEQSGLITGNVESQGPLGEDGAQVAFLGGDELNGLREDLLADPVLREGVGSAEQFPEFTPHLTLGYDTEPVPEGDLPQEVIFDRVAVWDGDEHTEYPLGPSASSEENTEGPEVTDDEGMVDELLVAMTRHIDDPLVVNDAATLASACAQADTLGDAERATTRRVLTRRARALGLQHVIPRNWSRKPQPAVPEAAPPQDVTAATPPNSSDVPDLFQLKTRLSALPDTALRTAYMRGVREYTMVAPQSRPPLPRDMIAQARVNSLIRLAQGDLSARSDDKDLLS